MYKTPREILKFTEAILSKLVPATNYILLDVKYRIISYFGRMPDLKWKGKMHIIFSTNIIVYVINFLLPLYCTIYVYAKYCEI